RGDVAPDAAVAGEGARGVEHRLAAHAVPGLAAEAVGTAELEGAEGPGRLDHRAGRGPGPGRHVRVVLLPARLAEDALALEHPRGIADRGEAELGILLPEDIRREAAQAPEARLALAHRGFRLRAAHQLADLAAHQLHRLQQAL